MGGLLVQALAPELLTTISSRTLVSSVAPSKVQPQHVTGLSVSDVEELLPRDSGD